MKGKLLSLILTFTVLMLQAQDSMEKTLENRAREFYRVLGLTDKGEYKKFMEANYTKAFPEKPMKASRLVSDSDGNSSTTSQESKNQSVLEAKTQMFTQLHDDFAGSRIISLKQKDNKVDMVLKSDSGLTGTFTFTFEKNKPYLIDGLGVQAEMEN
jgi:hypothetical protein